MTETAVVILNYNGSHFLKQFLPSVIAHRAGAKIVVADNGSTDDSLNILKDFPSVEIIEIGENLGFCGGYNYALKQVEATYYVLLNSDIEVTPQWITPIIDIMNADQSIAAAQPKILSHHHRTKFEYAGAAGGYIDALGYPFCRGRIFEVTEEDKGQYDRPALVFWATGACLFVRAELFHRAGGLDEDFFAHMEEIDLCWKLNRMGFKIMCIPTSKVFHVGGGTLAKSNPQKTFLNFRNGLSILYKHTSSRSLVWKFPLRLGLDWIAAIRFLISGQFRHALMIFNAHVNFWRNWQKENRKRKQLKSFTYTVCKGLVFPGLLILEYYLKGRRKFDQLKF